MRPLIDLTKKNKEFIWSESCEQAFKKLKQILTGPDILAYPLNDDGQFILDTDASDYAIGAVLSQFQNGKENVIAYGSRALNKSERNYCITDKELLALKNFIEYYRQYLLGRKFKARTDHRALIWLHVFSLKEPKSKIARWIEVLSDYDFTVEYRPGHKHGNADAMSRCENPKNCCCSVLEDEIALQCGPCKECSRRTVEMNSSMPEKYLSAASMARAVQKRSSNKETKSIPDENDVMFRFSHWKPSYTPLHLKKKQSEDENLRVVIKWLQTKVRPSYEEIIKNNLVIRNYWHLWNSLFLENGILYRKFEKRNGSGEYKQFIVPQNTSYSSFTQ